MFLGVCIPFLFCFGDGLLTGDVDDGTREPIGFHSEMEQRLKMDW